VTCYDSQLKRRGEYVRPRSLLEIVTNVAANLVFGAECRPSNMRRYDAGREPGEWKQLAEQVFSHGNEE
jgi:hypothetical protein